MKTNFRRSLNTSSFGAKRLAIVIVALTFAGLAFALLRSQILTALSPLWRGENIISRGLDNFFTILRSKESLTRENISLKERLVSYQSLLLSNRSLESSRDELLSHFGRIGTAPGIAAGVLVHPPETPYDIIVLDAGEAEGVSIGNAVSLPEGGALGRIIEVGTRESKADLYSTAGKETPAYLERGNVPVVLAGAGGGNFRFTLPRESAVAVGDKVLASGIRSELIGVVREVDLESTDSEMHVLVSGVANIFALRFVLIH